MLTGSDPSFILVSQVLARSHATHNQRFSLHTLFILSEGLAQTRNTYVNLEKGLLRKYGINFGCWLYLVSPPLGLVSTNRANMLHIRFLDASVVSDELLRT